MRHQAQRIVDVVVDLQYGSTGKGLIAGYLAERNKPDTVATAWAANAGHTYVDGHGRTFIHTMLANAVVSPGLARIMIGPGSILNLANLAKELDECADLLKKTGAQVYIHENAAVILDRHVEEEAGPMTAIGSTKKGVGAAAIDRIRRNPTEANTLGVLFKTGRLSLSSYPVLCDSAVHIVNPAQYQDVMDRATRVQVEGAQGFSLSMYSGFYPYTTSRDVSVNQLLADCGIPSCHGAYGWGKVTVIGTARTYPIRVANRFDDQGKQVGWSGPCFGDQDEISFADIGQKVELTTVTKLPRRIFTFSAEQIRQAIRMNAVDQVFLNFVNYVQPGCPGPTLEDIVNSIHAAGSTVRYLGYGPSYGDVLDLADDWAWDQDGAVRHFRSVAHSNRMIQDDPLPGELRG